jgi:DNA-binding transcriptional LysR family regulator
LKNLRLSQLEEDAFIFFSRFEAAGLFDQIIGVFQKENIVPAITSQPKNMLVLLTEVAAGLGVSVVPACIRNMYIEVCVFIPIQEQKPFIATQMHYHSGSTLPTVEAFAKITLENRVMIQEKMNLCVNSGQTP